MNLFEFSKVIKEKILSYKDKNIIYEEGVVISIKDGVIKVYGIYNVMFGEVIIINENIKAIVQCLKRDTVSAIIIGKYNIVKEGMKVKRTGKLLELPVGKNFLGRVVNGIGVPIDGKGDIKSDEFYLLDKSSPSIIERSSINRPLYTGYKFIDSMIPIGKGQRELIVGDRQTGKTTIALDIIMNQRNKNVKCIYVAIGQKSSTVLNIVQTLIKNNSLNYTVVVLASASDSASLQYLSPYYGCSLGEFFMNNGEDALIIYDDLSKHAIAYRQISLLLEKPPGREAYPGDIFFLHSKLLERSACVNKYYVKEKTFGKIKNKSGSLTAIPIIETQLGDVSSFIPTNVISITDGQIFLESNLFNSGIRPAINIGISVSRIGSSAQTEIMKHFSKKIKMILSQYYELSSFSQFSSELDKATINKINYGKKIIELLKQRKNFPMSISEEIIIFFVIKYNYVKYVDFKKIKLFEFKLIEHFKKNFFSLMKTIETSSFLVSDLKNKIKKVISSFVLNKKHIFN
ncbi:MAG: F0F1 ATP synthase subunit alpha [Enterobacteriaceae bacterium]